MIRDMMSVKEWFKTSLGIEGVNLEGIKTLFKDHLRNIYSAISTSLILDDLSFDDATIKFLFSVPATWDLDVVETFKLLIKDAGFGKNSKHHVHVGLTEPHATAAHELIKKNIFPMDGQAMLFVDAGGGTADFCLFKREVDSSGRRAFKELYPTTGDYISSTYIDSEFQVFQPTSNDDFTLHVPGLHGEISKDPGFDVDQLILKINDMANFFNRQVEKLTRKLRQIINDLACDIVLSGGLGSSQYLQHKLRIGCRVTYGRQLKNRGNAIQQRAKDEKRDVVKDRFGQIWTDNCVDWFVKKAKALRIIGALSANFRPLSTLTFRPRNAFVMSKYSHGLCGQEAPSPFVNGEDIHIGTSLRVDLSLANESDAKETKNLKLRDKLLLKRPYVKVEFTVKAKVGPANAMFQYFDANGRIELSTQLQVHTNSVGYYKSPFPRSVGHTQMAD
ncbi:hypothetical protein BGZ63DRAFT_427201 [Mariannaea sp. PMI_226]|nr:hypothetical protein BGZ63DRAFT_427201 [Mariannaea sp. PMI_226]